jgi:RNA polymerase-associated protein RTF1
MEMETDEEEDEDGQFTRSDEEDARRHRLRGKSPEDTREPLTKEDLIRGQITREMLAKFCLLPWFEEFVKSELLIYNT